MAVNLPDFMKSIYRIEVDSEWVLQEDPDYIVLLVVTTTYSGLEMDPPSSYDADDPTGIASALDAFKSRPEYANSTAVRENHEYIISRNMRNDATKGLIGAFYLAKIFHPNYSDLEREDLHKEYLQRFIGLNYNLDKHGIFVYPPLLKGAGNLQGVPNSYLQNLASV